MQQRGETSLEQRDSDSPPRVTVAGHELTLFTESAPMIAAMLADIRAARERVWMEVYIFADDAAGRAVAVALAERAQAGVDVRVMIDAWGSFGTSRALFDRMRAAGVQMHLFHALGQALRGPRFLRVLNQRNHRKLLVVDDQIAYFGGMNVVDQGGLTSLEDTKKRDLPASAGWRDVHVRMVGPRQAEIAAACDRLWKRVHHQRGRKERPWSVEGLRHAEPQSIFLFDSRPNFKNRQPQLVLVPLIQMAQREILVAMAYFVPFGRVLRELVRAHRRGVTVRVVVPGQSDVPLVQWATRHFYEYLLKRGIRLYERLDQMMHSKVMVIDDCWSVVGSCNLDSRSLRLNLEFFAVFHSAELATALKSIVQHEIRGSRRVTAEYVRSRSCWQRMLDRVAWSLRKWL